MASEAHKNESRPPSDDTGQLERVRDEVRSAGVSPRYVEEVATRLLGRDAKHGLGPIKDRTAYIRQTARRLAYAESLKTIRQRQLASNRTLPPPPELDPLKLASAYEEWRRLQQDLLALLTPEEAWILFGYFYEEKTNAEIASALGVTPQAVNKRIMKLLERLRQHVSLADTPPPVP